MLDFIRKASFHLELLVWQSPSEMHCAMNTRSETTLAVDKTIFESDKRSILCNVNIHIYPDRQGHGNGGYNRTVIRL